jgi:hypothetical protein
MDLGAWIYWIEQGRTTGMLSAGSVGSSRFVEQGLGDC